MIRYFVISVCFHPNHLDTTQLCYAGFGHGTDFVLCARMTSRKIAEARVVSALVRVKPKMKIESRKVKNEYFVSGYATP